MKPRHIAALALVGWYLMVPPLDSPNGALNTSANYPLSAWIHAPHEVFGTRQDCEAELANQRAYLESALRRLGAPGAYNQLAQAHVERMRVAQCISTDDPRLKEK